MKIVKNLHAFLCVKITCNIIEESHLNKNCSALSLHTKNNSAPGLIFSNLTSLFYLQRCRMDIRR